MEVPVQITTQEEDMIKSFDIKLFQERFYRIMDDVTDVNLFNPDVFQSLMDKKLVEYKPLPSPTVYDECHQYYFLTSEGRVVRNLLFL